MKYLLKADLLFIIKSKVYSIFIGLFLALHTAIIIVSYFDEPSFEMQFVVIFIQEFIVFLIVSAQFFQHNGILNTTITVPTLIFNMPVSRKEFVISKFLFLTLYILALNIWSIILIFLTQLISNTPINSLYITTILSIQFIAIGIIGSIYLIVYFAIKYYAIIYFILFMLTLFSFNILNIFDSSSFYLKFSGLEFLLSILVIFLLITLTLLGSLKLFKSREIEE
ncbi:MAG: ABC-2 transporter permease [Eubacteriales bacterium]